MRDIDVPPTQNIRNDIKDLQELVENELGENATEFTKLLMNILVQLDIYTSTVETSIYDANENMRELHHRLEQVERMIGEQRRPGPDGGSIDHKANLRGTPYEPPTIKPEQLLKF